MLNRADWDADAVRAELCVSVIPHLWDPTGVEGIAETGCVNKGRHLAGVVRPDRGPAGNVEHCQSGVLLDYALLDCARYRPKAWTDARARGRPAGIPAGRPFATAPQWARPVLARAVTAGVPATWVTGENVDGDARRRRL